jgi:hypothetical protein
MQFIFFYSLTIGEFRSFKCNLLANGTPVELLDHTFRNLPSFFLCVLFTQHLCSLDILVRGRKQNVQVEWLNILFCLLITDIVNSSCMTYSIHAYPMLTSPYNTNYTYRSSIYAPHHRPDAGVSYEFICG